MAELHLEGLRTDGEPHDLMTEADAEKRQLGRDGFCATSMAYVQGAGSPGPFERKMPSLMLHRFFKGRLSRHDRHTDAAIRKERRILVLMPKS